MGEVDKKALACALNDSIKDLQEGIDQHCCLVSAMMAGTLGDQDLSLIANACPPSIRELKLRKAIQETIETLKKPASRLSPSNSGCCANDSRRCSSIWNNRKEESMTMLQTTCCRDHDHGTENRGLRDKDKKERLRCWEVDHFFKCPIVGMCLSPPSRSIF